ncbi:MAG TPA: pilus assembly protein TadG-related protein [Mycobacteriales bacterium]|jgi:uncharacterized membrane protein|nr:pilus assembly protein TadG-related protein [Mycobacteriales bacterium]
MRVVPVRDDSGSIIPMILMAFVVAGLVIVGSVVAGSAFLAQRDLQSVCDGAAIAGAQALDDPEFYKSGVGSDGALPLGGVQSAVEQYAGSGSDRAAVTASVADDRVTVSVACAKTSHLTFGAVFGYGSGLQQHATAHARSRTDVAG